MWGVVHFPLLFEKIPINYTFVILSREEAKNLCPKSGRPFVHLRCTNRSAVQVSLRVTWEEGIHAMENKNKTLILGALIGAFTGLLAAMLLQRRAEKGERETAITTGESLKLGVLVFGLLRAIASLGDD